MTETQGLVGDPEEATASTWGHARVLDRKMSRSDHTHPNLIWIGTRTSKSRAVSCRRCRGNSRSVQRDVSRGHAAGTHPSSTAALINTYKSVTPSEAVRTIRCAIFAFVAGVRFDRSI